MNDPLETLISQAGGEVPPLTKIEREQMHALLTEYAAFRPLRTPAPPHAHTPWWAWLMRPSFATLMSAAVFVVGTGGAAYAAEGSLPGDALYPLKVDVTEPIVTALTPSGRAQATWQMTIAQRRLKEAASLSEEGRLATSTEAVLTGQAADATLKSAVDAVSLVTADATTTATTTAVLGEVSHLIEEGRGRLRQHDDTGATSAFRASIHAAATLEVGDDTPQPHEGEDSHDTHGESDEHGDSAQGLLQVGL